MHKQRGWLGSQSEGSGFAYVGAPILLTVRSLPLP